MSVVRKYDEETRARAVRMYQDRLGEGNISRRSARAEVGALLGVNEATLRNWVRRAVGEGVTPPVAERADDELVRLRRENAGLRRANEILKTASAFFAAAELDRALGQWSTTSASTRTGSGSSRS